jgi:hypothetical protein
MFDACFLFMLSIIHVSMNFIVLAIYVCRQGVHVLGGFVDDFTILVTR